MNYISKKKIRTINIETEKFGLYGDLIKNRLEIVTKKRKKIKSWTEDNKYYQTYVDQHKAIILNKNIKNLCTYKQGVKVLDLIKRIKKIK